MEDNFVFGIQKEIKTIDCEDCGQEVFLNSGWSNECRCGTEYNGFGQKLAPRDQWGWETGESF